MAQSNLSRPGVFNHAFAQSLVAASGPIALALLLPLMILAVGVPVALVVRGGLELVQWLMTVMR
jgi:hypothetical protein